MKEKQCPNCRKIFAAPLRHEPKYCSAACWYGSAKFKKMVVSINTGRFFSKKTRMKISAATRLQWKEGRAVTNWVKGHTPWNKGKPHLKVRGEKNPLWKGEAAAYHTKHSWVARWFGSPKQCEDCGTSEDRMYHWANISGENKRERGDWKRLCVPCHKTFDLSRKKKVFWKNQSGSGWYTFKKK